MGEAVTYTISQAAKLVGVESYVLRFWEEELLLDIGRNEKGYRAYTKENITLLLKVKELKKDHQLKDIRRMILNKDRKKEDFMMILDRLIGQIAEKQNSPEQRFRNIDRIIRSRQKTRKLVAAEAYTRKNGEKHREKKIDSRTDKEIML